MNISQHVFFDLGIKTTDVYYNMSGRKVDLPSVLMDSVGTDMSKYIGCFNVSMYFFPSYVSGSSHYSQRRFYPRSAAIDGELGSGAYLYPDSGVLIPEFFNFSVSSSSLTNLFTVVPSSFGFFPRCIFWYEKPSSSSVFNRIQLSYNSEDL